MFGSIIGAGIAAGASLFGSAKAADSAEKANATNIRMARAQMAFQRQERRTSYQTAVHDMVRAGLNPMLAYSQGGAPVTAGASATVQPTVKGNPYGEAAASALAALRGKAEIDVMETQAQKNQAEATQASAQTVKTQAETDAMPVGLAHTKQDTVLKETQANLNDVLGALTIQQRQKVMTEIEHVKGQIHMQQYTSSSAQSQALIDRTKARLALMMDDLNKTDFGRAMLYVDRVMDSLGKMTGMGSDLADSYRDSTQAERNKANTPKSPTSSGASRRLNPGY